MAESIEVSRPMLALAGLIGAIGVGLAAAASHTGAGNVAIAANFLQLHAPGLIGISFLYRHRLAMVAGYVLIVGLILFAGDLVTRTYLGAPLFPLAAPIGGMALIIGWLVLAASALVGWRRK